MWRVLLVTISCSLYSFLSADIRSHRAQYNIKLKHADQKSDIENVQGKMIFELTRGNGGWTISQESVTSLILKSGDSETLAAQYSAWESNDGQELKFKSTKAFDLVEIDNIEGQASFNKTGGHVTFQTPIGQKFTFNGAALPPVSHIKALVAAARNGKRMMHQRVFDGSFYGTEVGINTFISQKKPVCQVVKSENVMYQWPIKLAVFEEESESGLPTFEMSQNLSDNGIMCSYTMDFGDYSVTGTLEKIEYVDN